jgi:hypothetical protein
MSTIATTWVVLTVTARLYLACLLAYAAYTTVFLARALLRLRHPRNDEALVEIARKLETVRQANALLFLLFGVDLTIEMIAMIRTIGFMSMSLSAATISVFGPLVTFALLCLVVFTFLHLLQWIVTAKL